MAGVDGKSGKGRGMLEVDEIMAILRTSVDRVAALTSDATPDERAPAGIDEDWSLAAVMAHLRACNDVLGGAMIRILREEHPAWKAASPRAWQRRSGYHELAFEPSFEAFRRSRTELLDVLGEALPTDWERTAAVTVPPNRVDERSVHYYGDWLAQHEGTHVKDLTRRQQTRGT